jgi:hypothetical protein
MRNCRCAHDRQRVPARLRYFAGRVAVTSEDGAVTYGEMATASGASPTSSSSLCPPWPLENCLYGCQLPVCGATHAQHAVSRVKHRLHCQSVESDRLKDMQVPPQMQERRPCDLDLAQLITEVTMRMPATWPCPCAHLIASGARGALDCVALKKRRTPARVLHPLDLEIVRIRCVLQTTVLKCRRLCCRREECDRPSQPQWGSNASPGRRRGVCFAPPRAAEWNNDFGCLPDTQRALLSGCRR